MVCLQLKMRFMKWIFLTKNVNPQLRMTAQGATIKKGNWRLNQADPMGITVRIRNAGIPISRVNVSTPEIVILSRRIDNLLMRPKPE